MTDLDESVGRSTDVHDVLRPRVPDLFDLLDILVAMRLDICTAGDPACPVRALKPETIEGLCVLVNNAIASTHRLIDALDAAAPVESGRRLFDPKVPQR
jgi:hypothetical protein